MFTMGRETSFNVTDAETGLLDAESEMLAQRAEVSISAYRLLRVLGTLIESPDDLRPKQVDVSMNSPGPES
jgi:outer membrane protein TolC